MFVEYLTAEELTELNNMRNNYSLILTKMKNSKNLEQLKKKRNSRLSKKK